MANYLTLGCSSTLAALLGYNRTTVPHLETIGCTYVNANWGEVLKTISRLCYTLPWLPNSLDIQKTDKCHNIDVSCRIYGTWNSVQGSSMATLLSGGFDRGYGTCATVL
ncbi:hypothetical protein CROQUDRAFT_691621 [Cronartium quercuum f. sp. fusiforme G11]|uniref:Uncharacterized protein n=1 Tax=Cronartium quercuum f. sp. fusiforme G11 TaxID=708437 RepID=A0A9P6T5Z7_9BASI|nr:hypothetical protein CROQUDRAFT_691621 [Cronartium quercuum f. sp. fusiforme G11]